MRDHARSRVLLLLLALLGGCGGPQPTPPAASTPITMAGPPCPDAPGLIPAEIALISRQNLVAIAPDGSNTRQLTALPARSSAADPAWSPDGQTLAYTYYFPHPDPALAWLLRGQICGLDRATGKGRLLASAADALTVLEEPAWTADSAAVVATTLQYLLNQQKALVGQRLALVRYQLGQNVGAPLVQDGRSASISPDGKRLAYATIDPRTQATVLMIADADGQNPALLFAPANALTTVQDPLWAPNGKELAFTMALAGPPPAAAPNPADAAATPTPSLALLERLLGVSVASAHGMPAAIWTIRANGVGAGQVSRAGMDDPRVAWSPDGLSLAYTTGAGSVTLLELASGATRQLTDLGDFGIAWAR